MISSCDLVKRQKTNGGDEEKSGELRGRKIGEKLANTMKRDWNQLQGCRRRGQMSGKK